MTTNSHGRIGGALGTTPAIALSDSRLTAALTAIDKAAKLNKGFLTSVMTAVGTINGIIKTDGNKGDARAIAKKLIDTFVARYQTPLALRNAHLGRERELSNFATHVKRFGLELDFSDVGNMLEIAREGFGADVVELDSKRATGDRHIVGDQGATQQPLAAVGD